MATAQSFTFADTHPVNNVDNLVQWLANNPNAPALVRLRSLATLGNTYAWGYADFKGKTLPAVEHSNRQLRSPLSRAAYLYVKALAQGRYNPAAVSEYALAFLDEKKRLEQESRYQLREHQQENLRLRQQKALDDAQRQIYLLALATAMLINLLVAFFAVRLVRNRQQMRQTNAQLTEQLQEREQTNAQLAEQLQEREQTNAQLASAFTDVQQLNKSREHFIGIIAHDMRKPLISFRGMADLINMLLKQKAYQDVEQVSQAIDSAGLAIETMLDNLLKWALSQREAIPYNPHRLLVAPALGKVVSLYQQLVQFQPTTISLSCPEGLTVWADPNGLELIVRNLIDNALKHMQMQGQIVISCQQETANTIQLRITDTGKGVGEAKLAFLQSVLSGQVKGEVGQNGLGLGLLLVRDFAVRNQGIIRIESGAGQGTSFTLTLPAGQPAVVATPVALMPSDA
ncbi:ATP-binding protein [Spirosoma linguale]